MVALSFIPFFTYAAVHIGCLVCMLTVILPRAAKENHSCQWKGCHWIIIIGLIFVTIDCFRIGLGAWWIDTTIEDPPALAILYSVSVSTHLLLVPLFIWIQAEFYIALKFKEEGATGDEKDTGCETAVRCVGAFLSLLISGLLSFNLYAQYMAYLEEGYVREEEFGIVKYKWPSDERAGELGYPHYLTDLIGVISFAVCAVVVGALIWRRTGWYVYFVIAFIGLLGQGAGRGLFQEFHFFASNGFEICSFAGMVIADHFLFRKPTAAMSDQVEI